MVGNVLHNLAFHIAIDPFFCTFYLGLVGTLLLELLRRSVSARWSASRSVWIVLYLLLGGGIAILLLAVGSPLKWDVARHDIEETLEVNFGDEVGLLGYSLENQVVVPTDTIELTFYWHALTDMQVDYSIFVHFVDQSGNLVTQIDRYPVLNTHPTAHWLVGWVIEDSYALQTPADLPSGEYNILFGVYQWQTGERLPVYVEGERHPHDLMVLPETILVLEH